MKSLIPLIAVFLVSIDGFCQIEFDEHILSETADGAEEALAIDIDGDGDLDVLSSSVLDREIVWFENTNGSGTFSSGQLISNAAEALFVEAGDLDGDGDLDILASNQGTSLLSWFENLDGAGTFGDIQVLGQSTFFVWSAAIADLDGDGDLDLISAGEDPTVEIAWYENTNGQGDFGSKQIIYLSTASNPEDVLATDIDGDNDLDIVIATGGDDRVIWFENEDGNGTFGQPNEITATANNVTSIDASDIDGDNDLDILSTSWSDNKVVWYENTDGLGEFSAEIVISDSANGAWDVSTSDIDGDLDKDILLASAGSGIVSWIENLDGSGTFSDLKDISTEVEVVKSVMAADIDGDTDMDVITASRGDDKIAWHENLRILSIDTPETSDFFLYPNPISGTSVINFTAEGSADTVKVFDVQGRMVKEFKVNSNLVELNAVEFRSGLYFYLIYSEEQLIGTDKFIVR